MRSDQCHLQSIDGETESQRGKPCVHGPTSRKGQHKGSNFKIHAWSSELLLFPRHCAGTRGGREISTTASRETAEARVITRGWSC